MYKIIAAFMTLVCIIFGAEWQALNAPPAGRADDLSIGWDDLHGYWVIYAADQTHKLYKSINNGGIWDSLTYQDVTKNPVCVITDPDNAQVVYIGKNDETPVWKSENGGQTWASKSVGIGSDQPHCFAMDPYDPQIIYLGCHSGSATVFKSIDGGNNWSAKQFTPTVKDFAFTSDPNRNTTIYAACPSTSSDKGIWMSTNGGDSWSHILFGEYVYSIDFANQVVGYAGGYKHVYKTLNGGADWSDITLPDLVDEINDILALSPTHVYISTYGKGVYESTDGGTNWIALNNGIYCRESFSFLQHSAYPQTFFMGGVNSLYRTTNNGSNWISCNNGFKILPTYSTSSLYPLVYCAGGLAEPTKWSFGVAYQSQDYGSSWIPITAIHYEEIDPPLYIIINSGNTDIVYAGCYRSYFNGGTERCAHGGLIYRSSNAGYNWERTWGPPTTQTEFAIRLNTLYANHTYPERIYAGYDWHDMDQYNIQHGFIYNNNYGALYCWINEYDPILHHDSVYSITVHPTNGNILYAGTATHGLFRSINNGIDWTQTPLNNIDINTILIDPDFPDTMYTGSNNPNGIFKTNNGWANWNIVNNGLNYNYIEDFAIDPSEPTLFYALCKENAAANQTYVYCTVDRGARWFDVTSGIPAEIKTWDLEIDPQVADPVYAATDRGLYTLTPDFDKHMVSSSEIATDGNNGRKLIRIIETDNLWTVYESGGVIYAVHSSDRGQTWSKKMEIGPGFNPCIAAQPAMIGQPPMGIIWRRGNLIQDTIYYAYYLGDHAWSNPYMIAVASGSLSFDPPSMVIDDQGIAHAALANNGSIYHAWFDVTTPGSVSTELIITGLSNQNPKNPCVGFLSSPVNPNLHAVWEDDAVIYYSYRSGDPAVWSDPESVSASDYPILHDCHHPALEITGDVVYSVWDGRDESENQDIYWRNLTWIDGAPYWSWILSVYSTAESSEYPVLASGFYCSWVENDNEVFFAYYDPFMWVWTGQTNLSQSANLSGYPHLAYQQVWDATHIYFVWTENNSAPYHIEFRDIPFGGGGGGGAGFLGENGTNALGYYYSEAGKETKSPFNLKRSGIMDYGNEPYMKADYDDQYLEYKFTNLNPDKDYGIKVKFYQHGSNNLPLTVKINNVSFGSINIPQDSLITFQKQIPALLYKNKVINLKIYGNKALSGTMVFHEYERDKPKGGGCQDANTAPLNGGKLGLNIYPLPARNALKIEYFLPVKTSVRIGLYDVTGRLIAVPVSEVQNMGKHDQSLKIDELSQGVYFLRFESNDKVMVKKVTVLK